MTLNHFQQKAQDLSDNAIATAQAQLDKLNAEAKAKADAKAKVAREVAQSQAKVNSYLSALTEDYLATGNIAIPQVVSHHFANLKGKPSDKTQAILQASYDLLNHPLNGLAVKANGAIGWQLGEYDLSSLHAKLASLLPIEELPSQRWLGYMVTDILQGAPLDGRAWLRYKEDGLQTVQAPDTSDLTLNDAVYLERLGLVNTGLFT